jgi:hypothetical protein
MAAWREGDDVRIKHVANAAGKKSALDVAAKTASGSRWTLVMPRVLRGQVPKMRGCREVIYAGEGDIAAATTIIGPMITMGRVLHDVPADVTHEVVNAVAEKYGEAKRLSVKASPHPIEKARAVILAAWWSTRDDRNRDTVVA